MLRVEDRPLLTGSAEFVDDIDPAQVAHIRFFRSVVAHARIESVDVNAARTAPGVVAAYAGADVTLPPLHPPIENPDAFSPPRPLLAHEVVRFAGEPLAAVVAETPYLAEDAADLVDVALEPLAALVDPLAAMDAAPLHGHPTNVLFDNRVEAGDVETEFAKAAGGGRGKVRPPRHFGVPVQAPAPPGGACRGRGGGLGPAPNPPPPPAGP